MTKWFVIFNPAARGEKSPRLLRFLEDKAKRLGHVTLAPTTGPGDARRLAARAVAEGCHLIVAAGGDGTVNEVINGLGSAACALGILPLGTVNVLARELGIPARLPAAWQVLESGTTRTIDLGCAEPIAGDQATEEPSRPARRCFAQLAGVGFDAWAVRRASWELKKKIGPLSYLWAGLQTVAKPGATVELRVPSTGFEVRGSAVLIGNGRYYGGSIPVFPRARMDDGRLDVCVFEKGGYLDVLRYAIAVIGGRHTRLRDVRYFQADRFECRAAGTTPYEVDGELAGEAPVGFSVLPGALRVMVQAIGGPVETDPGGSATR